MTVRLLILSFSPIASDARVLKQVSALGSDFELVTCGYGDTPPGVAEHIRIPDDRVYWRYDRTSVILRRYHRAYRTNPAVAFADSALRGRDFDVILANDIDTVGLALALEPRLGVHADLHEYAPRQKEDVLRWRLFVAPFVRWMCRRFLPRAASVTTVGAGIAREYSRRFGVEAQVVTNSAPYADLKPTPVGDPIRLVHSGACLPERGIDQIFEAVLRTRTDVTLDLILMPNDPGYLEVLRSRAVATDRIVVRDAVPYGSLLTTLNAYDVGVHVLPPVNFNNAWALPNKFFDYIQARLGVVIGPSPEMSATVIERGNGAIAAGFTTDDLVGVFDALRPETVAEWKTRSDAAAFELSAGSQVEVWRRSVAAIAAKAG